MVIGFVFSWKLTLVILAFTPLLLVAGAIQMRIHTGQAAAGQSALEEAGKVRKNSLGADHLIHWDHVFFAKKCFSQLWSIK